MPNPAFGVKKEGDTMWIPEAIAPYFQSTCEKTTSQEIMTEGDFVCCGQQHFALEFEGEIKRSLWGMYLSCRNEQLMLGACCQACGRRILIFDNVSMGYDRQNQAASTRQSSPLRCPKCKENDFSVHIRLEYADIQEIQRLDTANPGNEFTWIGVTLKCNRCGKKYRDFLNIETG